MGTPGEEGSWRLGTEDLGQEENTPALGVVEAARIIAHSHHLAGGDDVHVARLYPPLPVPQPHRAAAPLEVGEHEEVVGVRVPGRLARGELPTEPYGTHRRYPGYRLVGVDGRPIPPPAQHPRRTQDNPSSPQRWGRSSSSGSQPMINRRSSHKAQTSARCVSEREWILVPTQTSSQRRER